MSINNASAQHFSVRANALLLPTGTINAGVSYDVSRKISIDLAVLGNPIKSNSISMLSFVAQPGVRYWLRETNYSHFFSLHANVGTYDLLFNNRSYKGLLAGIGVSWGYYFPIKKRLNLGIEIGAGLIYSNDTNRQIDVSDTEDIHIYKTNRWLFVPTKLEFCVVYLF